MVDYDPETEDLWTGHLVNNWWAEGEVRCQEGGCEEMMALLPVLLDDSYVEPGAPKSEDGDQKTPGE
jgi:hypothetical protein